jgi:hypothetical protein
VPQYGASKTAMKLSENCTCTTALTAKTIDSGKLVKVFKKPTKAPKTGRIRGLFFLRQLA